MREPITNKRQMYSLLRAGHLGNTIPNYSSLSEWATAPSSPLWGIRSQIPSDPRCRLNVLAKDVPGYFFENALISPMIDNWACLRGQICNNYLEVIDTKCPYVPWREGFTNHRRDFTGSSVSSILSAYLWPNDLEDMRILLSLYPDHVIEFTACTRAIGDVPLRNTVIWEARLY